MVSNELNVQVSPNPFSDRLNIKLGDLPAYGTASLQLFNLNGQLVLQKEVQHVNTLQWNIPAGLARGSYLLRIETAEQVISHRILKL